MDNQNPISGNNDNSLTPDQVAERGQKLYAEKLKAILEPAEKGRFVVIDVETGEYFLGDTALAALETAKAKYPNKLFHIVKVGYEGIFKMGSYSQRGFSYGW